MDHDRRTTSQTGRIDASEDTLPHFDRPGPLQRRIQAGSRELNRPAESERIATADLGMQYATIALLDGTVIGRLECDASLGRIVLGRASSCVVQVSDPYVHRVHAEIYWSSDLRAHMIAHAGGSNGTFVNLQRIDEPTRLIDGARIRVGKTELIYRRVYYPER